MKTATGSAKKTFLNSCGMASLSRALFYTLCALGKPFGGIRPRRIYNMLAKRGFEKKPCFKKHTDRWGNEFVLSPHLFLDRQIMISGQYDLSLHLFLRNILKPGMICMDIGANIGAITITMARSVSATGMVHAFEPVPPGFSAFAKSCPDQQA